MYIGRQAEWGSVITRFRIPTMGGGGGGWGVLGCPVAKPPPPHTPTLNGCRTSTILTTIYSCVYTYTYIYQKSYTVHIYEIYTYRRLHCEETVYFPELPIFCAVNTNWRCHITLLISPSCNVWISEWHLHWFLDTTSYFRSPNCGFSSNNKVHCSRIATLKHCQGPAEPVRKEAPGTHSATNASSPHSHIPHSQHSET